MVQRIPLVIGGDGLPQQLQPTDTITAPVNTPTIRPVTNAETTAAIVIGAQWDAVVTGETGGLTFGASYFLDPANVGKLTTTPPTTTGTGQVNTFVGTAISTTELEVEITNPILL